MVEPEIPEHTSAWPNLPEKTIVGGEVRNGKSAAHTALRLVSLDTAESEPALGGEQQ
jgi:hypothetical protein